jgi:hypothetical protein
MAKERIYRMGLADPRSGSERVVGLINRVVTGQGKAPVRQYDDSPTQMAKNKQRKPLR